MTPFPFLPRIPTLLLMGCLGGCIAAPRTVVELPRPSAPTRAPSEQEQVRAPAEAGRSVPPVRGPFVRTTPIPQSPQDTSRAGSNEAPSRDAPASRALLDQGRSERAAGSYTAAASSIERGLRIDPNNAALWLELGEIKLADGDSQQAQMMARKALTLAGGNTMVAAAAERLIERAARYP